jgi:signal transduction histidine kinase
MIWRQIQWRLTFWNTLLMAIVVAIFAGGVYITMSSTTWGQVSAIIDQTAGNAVTEWQTRGYLTFPTNRSVLAIQIADRSGQVLTQVGDLPVDQSVPPPGRSLHRVRTAHESVAMRTVQTGTALTTVAMDVTHETDRLEDLSHILVLSTLAAVLLSGAIGLVMARLALRPIDRMSAAARRIALVPGSGRLERLPLQPPKDELYRLGETFNAMLDRIERSFERQTRFVADASHELRTPLTVLQSYARLLSRWGRNDPAVLGEALGAMNREAERMGHLLEDLLLLARGDAGLKLERQPVSMVELLHDLGRDLSVAADSLGGRRTESPGTVQVQVRAPETAARVEGDPRYLRQLLLALADNAIQYTPAGGQVTLSLEQQEQQVLIHIADTGIGIPPEEQGHIFDRFQRVDKHRARATGGSGLGLSIATWLAHVHGGSITCQSRPGEGSTFTVVLPAIHD